MPDKKLCFVIGPIGDEASKVRAHADWLLEGIIEPVIAEFPDFVVKRADHDPRPGLIDAQMIDDLLNAELVIADLSFSNPNAFYEIGIRHMAQKPIIHMQIVDEEIPFDVSLYRSIKFSHARPRDLTAARSALRSQVQVVVGSGYQVENPVTNARGQVRIREHASSSEQVMLSQISSINERLRNIEAGELMRPARRREAGESHNQMYSYVVAVSVRQYTTTNGIDCDLGDVKSAVLSLLPDATIHQINNDEGYLKIGVWSEEMDWFIKKISAHQCVGKIETSGPILNRG
jgi:hypothetical protein